ncbi:hypothetical protein [Thiohalorhabdus sp.]|uniref:hypothetical protein n=1 Tax=Thiohalorhabdus sp. TaxID=3094134 RepID=UPI002FC3DAA2
MGDDASVGFGVGEDQRCPPGNGDPGGHALQLAGPERLRHQLPGGLPLIAGEGVVGGKQGGVGGYGAQELAAVGGAVVAQDTSAGS